MEHKPTKFINANISVELLERIKQAARDRSSTERRNVPYVELIREALEKAFPPVDNITVEREATGS